MDLELSATMPITAENIWASAQQLLREMLNQDIYHLWFAPLWASALDEESITLEVANDFCEVWLKDNYLGLLRDVLAQASGLTLQVKFHVGTVTITPKHAPSLPPARLECKEEPDLVERGSAVRETPFNPKNTFDTFVVGNNNTFAHAAAMAVSQAPGKSYNPLFLYGGVGLGKTHLLHAIGQHVASHKKGAKVTYLSSD